MQRSCLRQYYYFHWFKFLSEKFVIITGFIFFRNDYWLPWFTHTQQQLEAVTQRCSVKKVFLKISKKFTWKQLCQFLGKGVLKICSKFTGEHPGRSALSVKWQSNFIEIALRHESSPVNLLHIFRTTFPRNTSGWLLLINSDMFLTL